MMKIRLTTVTIALVSVPGFSGFAQSARTGVSNPEPAAIAAQADEKVEPLKARKPSAAIPAEGGSGSQAAGGQVTGARAGTVYGPYVPYRGGAAAGVVMPVDPDGQIVTQVAERAGELREGTLLRAHIQQSLSTVTTTVGSRFTAELTEAVEKDGRVVLPVGALVEGRVTEVHGGRRISGAATLHLEPKSVRLPDGTHYDIHAQLVDTDQTQRAVVDHEGTLVRRDHPRETLAAVGLATGGAAAAGAMIGGGVGAVVGAGIGAGAGTIVWLKQDRQAVLPASSLLVFSLTAAMPLEPVEGTPVSRVQTGGVDGRIVE